MNPGEHSFRSFTAKHDNKELAEIAGIHISTLYKYQQGNSIPSDVILKLADHFKCSTDRILGRVLPAEALTKENFPSARPNVAFTLSAEQLDYEKQCRELKFNMEVRNKRISELEAALAEANTYKNNYDELSARHTEVLEQLRNTRTLQNETVARIDPEVNKLKALLSAIHLLSEEK